MQAKYLKYFHIFFCTLAALLTDFGKDETIKQSIECIWIFFKRRTTQFMEVLCLLVSQILTNSHRTMTKPSIKLAILWIKNFFPNHHNNIIVQCVQRYNDIAVYKRCNEKKCILFVLDAVIYQQEISFPSRAGAGMNESEIFMRFV